MDQLHPGGATAEEALMYADGDAPASIAAHIRGCPICGAAAGEYARGTAALRERLYRFDCPPSHEIGEYALGLLDPIERTRAAVHIAACPRCAEELQTLRTFLDDEPRAPSPGPVERRRRLVATLLPTPTVAVAGLRGAADGTTRTYRVADISLTLDTEAVPGNGSIELVGLLWRDEEGATPVDGATVALVAPDDATQRTIVDDLGNFGFAKVDPASYRLEIALGDTLVVVAIDDLRIA